MNTNKPNFKANSSTPAATETPAEQKKSSRKEQAVVWEKETTTGEKYLNIKVNLPDGREMWLKAFKNKLKKDGDNRPHYVAWENTENK